MGVEIIAAVVMALVLTLVVGAVRLDTSQERRRDTPAGTLLSAEDRRLLHLLKVTPAEWLILTNQQQADMRERAYRGME